MNLNKSITTIIESLRGGLPAKFASQKLEDAINAAQETGKKAKITLEIEINPHGKDNREIFISMKTTAKLPTPTDLQEPSNFFHVRGRLSKDDPESVQPGLRGVESKDEAIGIAENGTGFGDGNRDTGTGQRQVYRS